MKIVLYLIIFTLIVLGGQVQIKAGLLSPFMNFNKYNEHCESQYSSKNLPFRANFKRTYDANAKFIADHNLKYQKGLTSYRTSDVNCLAHLDKETLIAQRCGFKMPVKTSLQTSGTPQSPEDIELMSRTDYDYSLSDYGPDYGSNSGSCDISKCNKSVDWRYMYVIPSVKQQGSCGSCWSFAATEVADSMYAFQKWKSGQTPTFNKLSQQHLVDCNRPDCNGCNGGIYTKAWKFMMDTPGCAKSVDYPYAMKDQTCKNTSKMTCVKVKSYGVLPSRDESCMLEYLSRNPCLAVAVNSSPMGFQYYESGVYSDPECDEQVNHAVILCGYGTDPVYGPYWLVKNSWGTSWGESGFMRLQRGCNMCGVAYYAAWVAVE